MYDQDLKNKVLGLIFEDLCRMSFEDELVYDINLYPKDINVIARVGLNIVNEITLVRQDELNYFINFTLFHKQFTFALEILSIDGLTELYERLKFT